MAATIAVLSQKGGTGKTTAVRTLTDVFQRIDLRVLAVDLDPQGNLSDYLDVDPEASPTIGDVLADRAAPADAVHDGIIPANLGLAEAELILGGKMGRELALKKALRELQGDYDVILVDCPPSLGLLTVNALVAARYALLSAEAQYFAMQGVEQALEVIELARDNLNPELEWLGIILNIADMRTRHSREAFDSLRQHFDDKLIETVVRASIAYAESAERARSILDYRPDLAADYLNVADELLRRLRLEPPRRRLAALTESLVPAAAERSAYVSALRLKWRPHHARPAGGLALEPIDHHARLLVVAPHEHARAGAGNRRPERAERGCPLQQLHRARVEMGSMRLVQAVAETRRDQLPVRPGETQDQRRGLSHVEHRVAQRDARRQRRSRRLGDHRLGRDHERRLEPHRRLEAVNPGPLAYDEAALQRGGDVVGMALELARQLEHVGVELEQVIRRE